MAAMLAAGTYASFPLHLRNIRAKNAAYAASAAAGRAAAGTLHGAAGAWLGLKALRGLRRARSA
jgi:hypothetical protein